MKRPTPTREELPSGVRPRTLKTEPNRKMAAVTKPAGPSQRQTRLVRWMASDSTATRAVIAQTTGDAALQLIQGQHGCRLVAVGDGD